MKEFTEVVGWVAVIVTTLIMLPQLISIYRSKNTKKINPFSFWILHFSFSIWLFYGYLINNIQITTSNLIATFISTLTIYALYRYSYKPTKKWNWIYIPLSFVLIFVSIFFILNISGVFIAKNSSLTFAFSIIAPLITTTCFIPNILIGIKKETIKYLSLSFVIIMFAFNILWIIYFSLAIVVYKNQANNFYIPLAFQCIALVIYGIQFYFWLFQKNKEKYSQKKIKTA